MRAVSTNPIDAELRKKHWRIDPRRSSVEFQTRILWGLTTVNGRFERYDGTLDLGAQQAIELTIDAESLTTNNPKRDEHLRSEDFFNVARYPQVRFISQSVTWHADHMHVRGELQAAGKVMPIEFQAAIRQVIGVDGNELEVNVEAKGDQRRLGMTWNKLGMVPNTPSKLIVRARLVRDGR